MDDDFDIEKLLIVQELNNVQFIFIIDGEEYVLSEN